MPAAVVGSSRIAAAVLSVGCSDSGSVRLRWRVLRCGETVRSVRARVRSAARLGPKDCGRCFGLRSVTLLRRSASRDRLPHAHPTDRWNGCARHRRRDRRPARDHRPRRARAGGGERHHAGQPSERADRAAANDAPTSPSVSADGRFVVFVSRADNLSADDNDGVANVFVRDLQAGTTTLVSRADGATGCGCGRRLDRPVDLRGRTVRGVRLDGHQPERCGPRHLPRVVRHPEPCPDIFVRDLTSGSTTLVSRTDGVTGAAATGASFVPTIFPDGGRVIFASVAPNLSTQDTDECTAASETGPFPAPCVNVFVRDVRAGTTRYVAPGRHQVQVEGCRSAVSGDGRFVAVETDESLDPADPGPGGDELYVIDLQTGADAVGERATRRRRRRRRVLPVSVRGRSGSGVPGASTQLDGGVGGSVWPEVYVRNLTSGVLTVVSRPTNESNNRSSSPSISGDGRLVAFQTREEHQLRRARGVRPRPADRQRHLRQPGQWRRRSPRDRLPPSMSSDGRVVAFASDSDTISPADNDLYRNIFVRELGAARPAARRAPPPRPPRTPTAGSRRTRRPPPTAGARHWPCAARHRAASGRWCISPCPPSRPAARSPRRPAAPCRVRNQRTHAAGGPAGRPVDRGHGELEQPARHQRHGRHDALRHRLAGVDCHRSGEAPCTPERTTASSSATRTRARATPRSASEAGRVSGGTAPQLVVTFGPA